MPNQFSIKENTFKKISLGNRKIAEFPRKFRGTENFFGVPRKFRGMENFSRGTIFGTEIFLKIDAEENAEWKMNFIPFADLWYT